MNSIVVKVWYIFKLSWAVTINDILRNINLLPLSPLEALYTTQPCTSSFPLSPGIKEEYIKFLSDQSLVSVNFEGQTLSDTMVILRSKWKQKLSRNLILCAADYNTTCIITTIPDQNLKLVQ